MPTTTFVWDPVNDCVISELDGTGATQAVYTNEPQQYGGVLSQRRGSTSRFLHADALGTTRLLTSTAGATTDTYLLDAWGNPVSSTGSTINPFRWVGRYGYYTDNATGLIYVRARMYQPTIARWVSVDPLRFVDGLNAYEYVRNSPCHRIDVTGLFSSDEFVAGLLQFMKSFSGRVGVRQCVQACSRLVTPPIGCFCITGCATDEVTDCCVSVVEACCLSRRKTCNILRLSIDFGVYECISLGGRSGLILPFPAFQIRTVPATKRPGSLTGAVSNGCPAVGHSGSFCVTASAGFATWTYGARACYDFRTGKVVSQIGFGIGTGTGVSAGGEYSYTSCGFPGDCCTP